MDLELSEVDDLGLRNVWYLQTVLMNMLYVAITAKKVDKEKVDMLRQSVDSFTEALKLRVI